jgi:hypothetical protein
MILVFIFYSVGVYAEENMRDLAKASLNELKVNHYAEHIALPFQEYLNIDDGKNNLQSILYLKPVVPFRVTQHYDLIIRTIFPAYERTPTYNAEHILNGKKINGWGDINPTFFIAPARFDKFIAGFGPSLSIPTSTNDQYIGTGKWSAGPELAVFYFSKNWVLGFLTDNLWSFAGDPNRPSVNAFQFQYQISYVSDDGWYISSNPSITANWKSPANQQWTVPFGGGAGRMLQWGHQPVNVGIFGYYNAVRPDQIGPNWQVQFVIEWLFKPVTIAKG